MSRELIYDRFSIISPSGKPEKPNTMIRLHIRFTSSDNRTKGKANNTDELFDLKDSYIW